MKEFEKLNLGMVAHTEGVTLKVESTLEQEIRKGELEDLEIKEIKETMERVKPQISQRMIRELYGSETGFVCQMWEILGKLS